MYDTFAYFCGYGNVTYSRGYSVLYQLMLRWWGYLCSDSWNISCCSSIYMEGSAMYVSSWYSSNSYQNQGWSTGIVLCLTRSTKVVRHEPCNILLYKVGKFFSRRLRFVAWFDQSSNPLWFSKDKNTIFSVMSAINFLILLQTACFNTYIPVAWRTSISSIHTL